MTELLRAVSFLQRLLLGAARSFMRALIYALSHRAMIEDFSDQSSGIDALRKSPTTTPRWYFYMPNDPRYHANFTCSLCSQDGCDAASTASTARNLMTSLCLRNQPTNLQALAQTRCQIKPLDKFDKARRLFLPSIRYQSIPPLTPLVAIEVDQKVETGDLILLV
jgi:hypothetical protein